MRNSNQILRGDQAVLEEIFTGSTMPSAKYICDMNSDMRSVCGSYNFLLLSIGFGSAVKTITFYFLTVYLVSYTKEHHTASPQLTIL